MDLPLSANSGHSSTDPNFLHSGRCNDPAAPGNRLQDSGRKFQFPLDGLEARLAAQRIEERFGLQISQL